MQPLNFDEMLARITTQDTRYHVQAYHLLRDALDYTQKKLGRAKKTEPQHVSGKELLEGIREYVLSQYGPMAKTVLNEWGLKTCEDFGELVFNMVDAGLLSKTENDSRDDFKDGYDFDQAFAKPFRPKAPDLAPLARAPQAGPS